MKRVFLLFLENSPAFKDLYLLKIEQDKKIVVIVS